MEAAVLDESGTTGYLTLSGNLLFGIIIIVVNCKILSMTTGVKLLNTIVVIISVGLYWASQALVGSLLGHPQQLVILNQ